MPYVGTADYCFAALFFSELSILSLANVNTSKEMVAIFTICQDGIGHNCILLFSLI